MHNTYNNINHNPHAKLILTCGPTSTTTASTTATNTTMKDISGNIQPKHSHKSKSTLLEKEIILVTRILTKEIDLFGYING